MRSYQFWGSAKNAGRVMAGFALIAAVGGCGMQMPSIRSPFYLANNNAAPVQHRALKHDNIYVPPKVEYYCRGPNFDPNAECLPPRRAAAKPAPRGPSSARTIIVQHGETLYSIARRHRIGVDELADKNGLETHQINAGQELDLPQYALR